MTISSKNNTLPEESLDFSRSELLRSGPMRSASMRHDEFTVSERADWLLNDAFKSTTITMEDTTPTKPIRKDEDTASETSSTTTLEQPEPTEEEQAEEEQAVDDKDGGDHDGAMLSCSTRGIISRPSMCHEKFTVGDRAKWLQSEAFQSPSEVPTENTKESRHSTEQRGSKLRRNAKNKAEELISKFGGKAKKKTAVLRRKEEFERQESENTRKIDPRSFSKTTWSSKSRCSSGRYTKMVTDTRGVAPKKSLQDLP